MGYIPPHSVKIVIVIIYKFYNLRYMYIKCIYYPYMKCIASCHFHKNYFMSWAVTHQLVDANDFLRQDFF